MSVKAAIVAPAALARGHTSKLHVDKYSSTLVATLAEASSLCLTFRCEMIKLMSSMFACFRYNNTGGCGNVGCSNVGTSNVGSDNSGSNNKGDNNDGSNNVGYCLNGSNLSGDDC